MSDTKKAPLGGSSRDDEVKYLTIDQIRSAADMEPVDVYVPQWGGNVKVKPLSMTERSSIRKEAERKSLDEETGAPVTTYDGEEMEIAAVIACCISPTFSRSDKKWLREEKSAGAISRIATKIFNISGMGRDAEGKHDD